MTVGYVPLGRDAAVAGDYKDLKFKNDTEYPVYIEAYAKDGKVVCNIYGHEIHDAGHKVDFELENHSLLTSFPFSVTIL